MGQSLTGRGDGEELLGVCIRLTKTYGDPNYASSIGKGISLLNRH